MKPTDRRNNAARRPTRHNYVRPPVMRDEIGPPAGLGQKNSRRAVEHHRVASGDALNDGVLETRRLPEKDGLSDNLSVGIDNACPAAIDLRPLRIGAQSGESLFQLVGIPQIVLIAKRVEFGFYRFIRQQRTKILHEALVGARQKREFAEPAIAPSIRLGLRAFRRRNHRPRPRHPHWGAFASPGSRAEPAGISHRCRLRAERRCVIEP